MAIAGGVTQTKEYLDSRVMPAIFEALRALDAARPNDPLNFIATELEAHSIDGMHNAAGSGAKAGGDMFAYTNGIVRDALLKSIRAVAVTRPREPLKAIAADLRSMPAWSPAAGALPSTSAAQVRSGPGPGSVSSMSMSLAPSTAGPGMTSSSQLRAGHLQRAASSADRFSEGGASSVADTLGELPPTSSAVSSLRSTSRSWGATAEDGGLRLGPPPSPTTSGSTAAAAASPATRRGRSMTAMPALSSPGPLSARMDGLRSSRSTAAPLTATSAAAGGGGASPGTRLNELGIKPSTARLVR